jgi:hypothetical protein
VLPDATLAVESDVAPDLHHRADDVACQEAEYTPQGVRSALESLGGRALIVI